MTRRQPSPDRQRQRSLGWPLALVTTLIILCFGLSLWLTQIRLAPVQQHSLDIISNAAPSITELTRARTELQRLERAESELVLADPSSRPLIRQRLNQARLALRRHMDFYLQLPSFEGERERAPLNLALLDHLDQLLQRFEALDRTGARALLLRELHPTQEQLDEELEQLVELNSRAATDRAVTILKTRSEAQRLAWYLGLASAAAALIASVLAWRALRMQRQLESEHSVLLEERARELEAFSGRVAHDLRGPLGAIALRVVSARRNPQQAPEALKQVARQTDRMNELIDGLLAFARAGGRPAMNRRTDLAQVIEEVLVGVQPPVEELGVELKADLRDRPFVRGEPGALASVVSNLVRNALKYIVEGRQGVRRIEVQLKEHDGSVRVEVWDTGPGLPPGFERQVFEPFVRAPGTRQPGLGLGLATVRRVVEGHGGRVGVESKFGEGSCFWFELPKAPADVVEAPRPPAPTEGPQATLH